MELEQLKQLEAVDRYGTMSAAAEHLHITQPSLSRSIKRLENDLGQELFDRTGNRAIMNDAGRLALENARVILTDVRRMREAFDELARRQRTLKVASVAPAPNWRLSALVIERFPSVILEPELVSPREADAALINREADFSITLHPLQLPGMVSVPLMTEDLYASVPADNELVKKKTVSFADLDGESFIIYEQVGFWKEVCDEHLPHSQIIIQKDRNVFLQLTQVTELLCFTTDAPENATATDTRVRIPIVDGDAHATFFLNAHTEASEQVTQIVDWVRQQES